MLEIAGMVAALMLAGTSASAATAAEQVRPADKLICRRMAETGSLVRKKRVCHTQGEWARISDAARKNTQELQDARNGTQGN